MISQPSSTNLDRQKRILCVDNEPEISLLLEITLEHAGFGIDIFNDPVLALVHSRPDL